MLYDRSLHAMRVCQSGHISNVILSSQLHVEYRHRQASAIRSTVWFHLLESIGLSYRRQTSNPNFSTGRQLLVAGRGHHHILALGRLLVPSSVCSHTVHLRAGIITFLLCSHFLYSLPRSYFVQLYRSHQSARQ